MFLKCFFFLTIHIVGNQAAIESMQRFIGATTSDSIWQHLATSRKHLSTSRPHRSTQSDVRDAVEGLRGLQCLHCLHYALAVDSQSINVQLRWITFSSPPLELPKANLDTFSHENTLPSCLLDAYMQYSSNQIKSTHIN